MRQILFYGIMYEVPEWARFILQSKEGKITVHEVCPNFGKANSVSKGKMQNVEPLRYPTNVGIILDQNSRCVQLSSIPT